MDSQAHRKTDKYTNGQAYRRTGVTSDVHVYSERRDGAGRVSDHAENVEDNLEADPDDDQSSTSQPSLMTLPGFVRSPDTR
ncbi:unnamed protein product [Arctia plantaginis]|uniref:Uncharacterized protein n=1 Tax=Arctia plantaginis TaxID=874455 RepID=A0A8S0Z4K9_ARCPL|nr:unnamed protein product [Arctia plantaginis]